MESTLESAKGYAEEADELLVRYESYSFEGVHSDIQHLLPSRPGLVLDVGSGTGRDAGYFAEAGHRVVAIEPTAELRIPAARLHPSTRIDWIDDCLPELKKVVALGKSFDLVMLTAVWMHLDVADRENAMPVLASLMSPVGRMIFLLRHGPVPPGRQMFEISAEETIALAGAADLRCVVNRNSDSGHGGNKQAGVTWTRLAFER